MQITVSAIGLAGRDLGFLNSIFRLSPKLQDQCTFVGVEKRRGAGRLANVVFVNADDADAVSAWKTLAPYNPHTTPIMVTYELTGEEDVLILQRPLVLRKVLEILEQVTGPSSHGSRGSVASDTAMSVLVVDDSFPVRKFMEEKLQILSPQPIHLEFASSGDEAIMKTQQDSYDLVFLDVVMPGLDGYSACKKIKSGQSGHVVMLTSKKSPFDKIKGALSGADAYITKPPQDARLKEILDTALAKSSNARRHTDKHVAAVSF
jgi:twitching motility two-component system response regulator PilG